MSDKTAIEWTDATWNPVTGCNQVSSGCAFCYAKRLHDQRFKAWSDGNWPTAPEQYRVPFETVQCHPDRLSIPLSWKKPRKIFVNSMSDLFHESVNDVFIDRVFAVMARCPRHTFQILTKRAARLPDYFHEERGWYIRQVVDESYQSIADPFPNWQFPLPNVWLGVSVENQATANERIPALIETPAAVRFLSCEPLLSPIDLSKFLICSSPHHVSLHLYLNTYRDNLHQVIVGGESGPGARPMHPDWARDLRDQCIAAGVPFFFKQWGEWIPEQFADGHWPESSTRYTFDNQTQLVRSGKTKAGRLLDGREWNEYPKTESVLA